MSKYERQAIENFERTAQNAKIIRLIKKQNTDDIELFAKKLPDLNLDIKYVKKIILPKLNEELKAIGNFEQTAKNAKVIKIVNRTYDDEVEFFADKLPKRDIKLNLKTPIFHKMEKINILRREIGWEKFTKPKLLESIRRAEGYKTIGVHKFNKADLVKHYLSIYK